MTSADKKQQASKYIISHISLLIFYFFTASIGGFLWEVLIFLVKEGQFRNRGFLYGPWLPVYGSGAILMYLLFSKLKAHPVRAFLFCALLGSFLELTIGWTLRHFWGLRYWDYTTAPFNFHGYICLASVLGIGIGGALWICLLSAPLKKIWFRIPKKIRDIVLAVLIFLFITDCAAALIFPNTGRGITFS